MLKEVADAQRNESKIAENFRKEIKQDVKDVKKNIKEVKAIVDDFPKDYIPKEDVAKIIRFMRWLIATLIALGGVLVLWLHGK